MDHRRAILAFSLLFCMLGGDNIIKFAEAGNECNTRCKGCQNSAYSNQGQCISACKAGDSSTFDCSGECLPWI